MSSITKILALLGIFFLLLPAAASASLPYWTEYIITSTGQTWGTQPLYTPRLAVTGIGEGGTPALSEPSDLYITADDSVYVADTGNNRIAVLDRTGNYIRQIGAEEGEGKLNAPEGVYVTGDGTVYAADTGNRRIAVYDSGGTFVRAFGKPESELLPESYYFVPAKVAVDERSTIYAVSKGSYQGIVRMNAQGAFTGFFGANKASLSFTQWIQRQVLSKEQLKKEKAALPGEVGNIAIDRDGFLLTANFGVFSGQIKKLNAGGVDMLGGITLEKLDQLVDVAVDPNGFLFSLARNPDNTVGIYDPSGRPLFRFGGISTQASRLGLFSFPTAIALSSEQEIWIADSKLNTIQVFAPTEFGLTILKAMALYDKGYYADSETGWRKAVGLNEMIDASYKGLGEAALYGKRYSESLAYFKLGGDAKGYSESFWNVRLDWIRSYLAVTAAAALAVGLILRFAKRPLAAYAADHLSLPQGMRKYRQEWRDFRYVMLHPYEGFYRIKERKVSYLTLLIIMLLAIALTVCRTYWTGFVFDPEPAAFKDPWTPLLKLLGVWSTWVVANYLVSTVKDGEGRFREVLQASVYALVPYILLMAPVIVLTNIVVLEERIIVDGLLQVMWLWVALLLFVMTQVIHNFDFMEAFKNSLITLFTIVVIWVLLIILGALSYNVYNFIYELTREVGQYV
ncbi:YIP1 family protein [Paenibacillus nasutitermitis]|uniref:Yip1 domain-containing protein n=1 Tax=Paenibacillus nasutitermitis TaxID=1652958 RepID=A0A917DPQ5_9BACL|nr:YIP1 family protein [Paenibacillus nasutitermitis]GGD57274.1 hypothetical protein GCM10010911_13810 [Paenibacillus nasutitermitis]